MNKTIQDLFNEYELKSIEVEETKRLFDESEIQDLSNEKYISAEQADQHIIASVEREHKENALEEISREWALIQDELVSLLCRVNTKVVVKDIRDNTELLIHCEAGSIVIEEKLD